MVEKERNVSNLFDKLLSSCKDFHEDEGKAFLRESLQIKLIDTGKIRLPELGNIQLSQHSALKKVTSGELNGFQASLPVTESPLGAISALRRRAALKELNNLYSVFCGDDTPCSRGSSSSRKAGKLSLSPVNIGNHDGSDFLFDGDSYPVIENATKLDFEDGICEPDAAASIDENIITEENSTENPHPLLERSTHSNSNVVVNDNGDMPIVFIGGLLEASTSHVL